MNQPRTVVFTDQHPALHENAKHADTIDAFIAGYGLCIHPIRRDAWRMVKPNRGDIRGLPHFGEVIIRATDGVHCYVEVYWHDLRPVVEVNVSNFLGKVESINVDNEGWSDGTRKGWWPGKEDGEPKPKMKSRKKKGVTEQDLIDALEKLIL